VLVHLVVGAIGCAILWYSWTGFISSDDEYYAVAGVGWSRYFPYVARHFGEIRAAVVIPIAIFLKLLGESEFAVVASTCLFYLAMLSVSLIMLSRVVSMTTAFVATATLATMPLLAIHGTIPNADFPELFFVVVSFFLFWLACQRQRRIMWLTLAGVAAALAFSAHEISLALLLFYGLLFVFGYGIPRVHYWVMALGFLSIVAIECLYYWIMTGDALYRFTLFFQGAGIRDREEVGFLKFTPSGTLHVWDPIDPLIMFFTHLHQFSVLIFFAVPALIWAFAGRADNSVPARKLAFLLTSLGVVWLVFGAFALTNQKLLPRYYSVTAYCFFMTAALWAAAEIWPRHRLWVSGGIAVFVLIGLVGIQLANKNPRYAERELVRYLATTDAAIHTDPMTEEKSRWYCRWQKLDCLRIKSSPPVAGSLYYYNPQVAREVNRLMDKDRLPLYQPQSSWTEVWRLEEDRGMTTSIMKRLGIERWLPQAIQHRINRPGRTVSVFRVP